MPMKPDDKVVRRFSMKKWAEKMQEAKFPISIY